MYVLRNNEARSCNHCCPGKVMSITYSECEFVALGIQPAKIMHHIVICGPSGCTIFFHIISRFSEKKELLDKNGVFCFMLQIWTFLILRRFQQDIMINVHRSPCKAPLLLSDFRENWIFSTDFRKNTPVSNFMKIRPVGAELFHADGRARVTKLTVAFRNLFMHFDY
jgi:hypothetical protein